MPRKPSVLTGLRAVGAALLLGLVLLAGSPVAAAATEPVPSAAPVLTQEVTPPPGPKLDPSESERVDSEQTKKKIIVGVAAVVLAGIVFWGRRVRSKRKSGG